MPKRLYKIQVLRQLAKANNLTVKQTELFFDSLFTLALQEIKKNKKFAIPNLGILKVVKTKARTGQNPRTGEVVPIPPTVKIRIRFLKQFQEAFELQKRN